MYSPTLGRFMERDPDGYIDGPNDYQFEKSNPVIGLDPTGLADDPICVDEGGLYETAAVVVEVGVKFLWEKYVPSLPSFGSSPTTSTGGLTTVHTGFGGGTTTTGTTTTPLGGGLNSSTLPPPSALSGASLNTPTTGGSVGSTGSFTGTRGSTQGYQSPSLD